MSGWIKGSLRAQPLAGRTELLSLLIGLAMVVVATAAGTMLAPRWGNSAVDLLYLPAVLGAAIIGGLRPALFSAVASAIAFNFFFTAPRHTFRIDNPVDVVTVAILLLVAIVASQLAASVRKQAQIAQAHAARNATIAGFARRLLSSTNEQGIGEVATEQLATLFECKAVLVGGSPNPGVIACAPASARIAPADVATAVQTIRTGRFDGAAGSGADRAKWQFHPVRSESSTMASAGLAREDGSPALGPAQLSLLQNLLDQVALALERARLEGGARELAALRERDRIRSALLSTIGQDLKPRLANIIQTVDELRRTGSAEKTLVSTIGSEAARLKRYISGLVDLGLDSDERPIKSAGVSIDLFRRAVSRDGQEVHLTPKEYAVLAELAKHPGRVLTHGHLLRTAWGPAQEGRTEYLRVAVRALRQKLERDPARPRLIINEPAIGYRLVSD
jgi:two-component system, OmpR family, sensor histidine kinase KdpD